MRGVYSLLLLFIPFYGWVFFGVGVLCVYAVYLYVLPQFSPQTERYILIINDLRQIFSHCACVSWDHGAWGGDAPAGRTPFYV